MVKSDKSTWSIAKSWWKSPFEPRLFFIPRISAMASISFQVKAELGEVTVLSDEEVRQTDRA